MRHFRTRRHYRVILALLLVFCVTLFIESKIEALMPDLKHYAEMRVERFLGGRISLSIGSVSGGLLQPISLNNIVISQVRTPNLLNTLTIDSIRTNYRMWDLLKMRRSPTPETIFKKDFTVYVYFSLGRGDVIGFAGLEGDLDKSRVSGYLRMPRLGKIDFTGAVKDDNFDIIIRPYITGGFFRFIGKIDDHGGILADFKIDHVKIKDNDISCDGKVIHRVTASDKSLKGSLVEGEIVTEEVILNHKPFLPISAVYSIKNRMVKLKDVRLGDSFRISGAVSMNKSGPIDLKLTANNVSLAWLYQQLRARDASSMLTGTLNGKVTITGSRRHPRTDAQFDIRKGTMAAMDFDFLTANLKGDVPFLKIEEARVTRPSGYFEIAGELDMSRIGKSSFFENLSLVTDDGAITWDQWNMVKRQDVREISMTKNLTSDIGISYKKFIADQKIDESMREDDKMRFQYKLGQNESLGMMMSQNEDFIGFEHKDRF